MYCATCGQQNPDTSKFCNNCGATLAPVTSASATPLPPLSNVPPPPGASVYTPANAGAPNDGKAVASLILGILGMTLFSFLAGIPAIILGHMSRANIRRSMGKLKGDGMALAGLIMGYLSLLAIPFILIVAAIAIPNLLRARISANEASSVASIRTISTANAEYAQRYGGFAPSLDALGGTNCANTDKMHACLIDATLASGQKSGYRFTYTPEDTDGDGAADKYFLTAEAIQRGTTGRATFCSDETAVIHKDQYGRNCTAESPVLY